MFHKHSYKTQRRVFTPPPSGNIELEGPAINYFMDTTYGFTSIELKCNSCGLIKFIKQNGDQT
jgi:hypothetical protein